MDLSKKVEFSLEFVKRLIERSIMSAFDNDLDKAVEEIERKMRNESVIIENPSDTYPNQCWCIINIERVGLAKIPIAETPRCIKAITIACPVTDHRCIEPYRKKFMSNKE